MCPLSAGGPPNFIDCRGAHLETGKGRTQHDTVEYTGRGGKPGWLVACLKESPSWAEGGGREGGRGLLCPTYMRRGIHQGRPPEQNFAWEKRRIRDANKSFPPPFPALDVRSIATNFRSWVRVARSPTTRPNYRPLVGKYRPKTHFTTEGNEKISPKTRNLGFLCIFFKKNIAQFTKIQPKFPNWAMK